MQQIEAHIKTGTIVASRFLPDDEFDPAIRRDKPGLVELSRAEPTRGSLFVDIEKPHRLAQRRAGYEMERLATATGRLAGCARIDVVHVVEIEVCERERACMARSTINHRFELDRRGFLIYRGA